MVRSRGSNEFHKGGLRAHLLGPKNKVQIISTSKSVKNNNFAHDILRQDIDLVQLIKQPITNIEFFVYLLGSIFTR